MKIFIALFLLSMVLSAQNKIVIDETTQKQMLVGYGDRTVFSDSSFKNWFDEEYIGYKILDEAYERLSVDFEDVKITIVLGTWCSDSRREVPRFFKILDEINFPEENTKLIFVNRSKNGLSDEVEGLNIEFVPTIIFYRNKDEIGRIIETPNETLEEDFISLLN